MVQMVFQAAREAGRQMAKVGASNSSGDLEGCEQGLDASGCL
jgi:hypothetical protein